MSEYSVKNICISNMVDGLRKGLSLFSGPSRAALLYSVAPEDSIRIYDPQDLLRGHEPKLRELYLDSNAWRTGTVAAGNMKRFGHIHPEKNLQLTGLISCGGRSHSISYQMWFTDHHPDMCSVAPTEKWLEYAAWLLSHEFANDCAFYTGTSRYALREYATHAVRDHVMDELNLLLGWDTYFRVFPILDVVLEISKTLEEGAWPHGKLVFVPLTVISQMHFLVRFPPLEQPGLQNFKHVRKLLVAVEHSERKLVAAGKSIVGIATGELPRCRLTADFKMGYGFLKLGGQSICSFSDGSFHSTTRKPNLVQLEEALLGCQFDSSSTHILFKIVSSIVQKAGEQKHGCTLVIDLNDPPLEIPGQPLEHPIDLQEPSFLELAKSLAKIDGALHIGADLRLYGFACLLDGLAVPGEDRSRGARYNSALRFTARHEHLIVVVVSSDRPVSILQGGVELSTQCEWKTFSECALSPPTLEEWLQE